MLLLVVKEEVIQQKMLLIVESANLCDSHDVYYTVT